MTKNNCVTSHVAFFDESNWNTGRFRSISMVSLEYKDYLELKPQLCGITSKKSHEMKWVKIDAETGMMVIDFFFNNIHKMRIDVLTWDMEDSRHKGIIGRDDKKDLQRLYFRLMTTVMRDRWPNNASWTLFPDEHNCISFPTIKQYLDDYSWEIRESLFNENPLSISFEKRYMSRSITPMQSHKQPFIQLADFFAGIAVYSYQCFDKVIHWKEIKSAQTTIFQDIGFNCDNIKLSRMDKIRIPLILELKNQAKRKKLRISLDSSSGLRTRNPVDHLNFWLYQPQHEKDKAPVKPRLSGLKV